MIGLLTFLFLAHTASSFDVDYFVQPVDHFSFSHAKSYFKQRYFIQQRQGASCVLFYTGNEGPITAFVNASGFLPVLANALNAQLVFAEHRDYGESHTHSNFTHLSSAQAIADFVALASSFSLPVVAVGGSYGGMLASWAHQQHPNVFVAAYASSAPLRTAEKNLIHGYYDVVESVYPLPCRNQVKEGMTEIVELMKNEEGIQTLTKTFDLCEKADGNVLIGALQYSLSSLATSNYPYTVNFLGNDLPANPVNVSCGLAKNLTGLEALREVVSLIWKKGNNCVSLSNSPLDYYIGFIPGAWSFERCSEVIIPTSISSSQMFLTCSEFPFNCWNPSVFSNYCEQVQQTSPVMDAVELQYGSASSQYQRSSKVVFTNGFLDPWSYGGFPPSSHSFWMEGAAHHLDLRAPNKSDPIDVVETRKKVEMFLKHALGDFSEKK